MAGNQVRHDGHLCRGLKRTGDSEQNENGQNDGEVDSSRPGSPEQDGGADSLQRYAAEDNPHAGQAVRRHPRYQKEQREGGELGKADQPEIELARSQPVNLPANGRDQHFRGQNARNPCGPEIPEI